MTNPSSPREELVIRDVETRDRECCLIISRRRWLWINQRRASVSSWWGSPKGYDRRDSFPKWTHYHYDASRYSESNFLNVLLLLSFSSWKRLYSSSHTHQRFGADVVAGWRLPQQTDNTLIREHSFLLTATYVDATRHGKSLLFLPASHILPVIAWGGLPPLDSPVPRRKDNKRTLVL